MHPPSSTRPGGRRASSIGRLLAAAALPLAAVSTVGATVTPSPASSMSLAHVRSSPRSAPEELALLRQLGRQRAAAHRVAVARHAADDRRAVAARASRSHVRAALAAAAALADRTVTPTSGPMTQPFNPHPGIDLAPPYGTPVVAAHAGTVTFVGWQDGYGMHVEITQADGWVTTYSHLSAFYAVTGQAVGAGTPVGAVGSTGYSTGPHLHFEVHAPGGVRVDPAAWLVQHGAAI